MFINLSFQKRLFTAHGEMDLAIDLSAKKGEIILYLVNQVLEKQLY
jgi:hypothetical protein